MKDIQNLPIINNEIKLLNSKIEIENNTDFKTFIYKDYEIKFDSGKIEHLYSIAIEIPIIVIKKEILKSIKFNIFKYNIEIPIITKTNKIIRNFYFEIPFKIIDDNAYNPSNYVDSFYRKIIFNENLNKNYNKNLNKSLNKSLNKLKNIKFKNGYSLYDLDKIKNIIDNLKFEIEN